MSVSLPATTTSNTTTISQQPGAYSNAPPPGRISSSPDSLQPRSHQQSQAQTHQQDQPLALQTQNHGPTPQQPQYPLSEHIDQLPLSKPISESDNPDAIALRAAMSVLQIQRQQALRDLKKLEAQKEAAIQDPEGFARAIQDGRVKARGMSGVGPYPDDADSEDSDDEEELDEKMGEATAMDTNPPDAPPHSTSPAPAQPSTTAPPPDKYKDFGKIPSSQNAVRMPPINWAKYHVVGESLDKLHEEQRLRPSPGQPARDEDLRPRERAPESMIAGPYNPWVDKVGTKEGRTRSSGGGGGKRGGKKKKG